MIEVGLEVHRRVTRISPLVHLSQQGSVNKTQPISLTDCLFWLYCSVRFIPDFTGPRSLLAQMLVFPDTGYGQGATLHTKPDRGSHMADGALMNQRVLIGDVSLETHSCPFPSGLTLLKTLIYRATSANTSTDEKSKLPSAFFPSSSFFLCPKSLPHWRSYGRGW